METSIKYRKHHTGIVVLSRFLSNIIYKFVSKKYMQTCYFSFKNYIYKGLLIDPFILMLPKTCLRENSQVSSSLSPNNNNAHFKIEFA